MYSVTDRQTNGRTDSRMMPIADRTMKQYDDYDRLKN